MSTALFSTFHEHFTITSVCRPHFWEAIVQITALIYCTFDNFCNRFGDVYQPFEQVLRTVSQISVPVYRTSEHILRVTSYISTPVYCILKFMLREFRTYQCLYVPHFWLHLDIYYAYIFTCRSQLQTYFESIGWRMSVSVDTIFREKKTV